MKERHPVMTCARCGQPLQPGISACPRCGLPLTPPPMPPISPMSQAPQPPYGQPYAPPYPAPPGAEPAMPAWLRALQEHAGAQPGTQPGMLPGGMPPQAPGMSNQPWGMPSIPAGPIAPGGQPGAFGSPAGGPPPSPNLSMSSLINGNALPEWMRAAPAAPSSPTPMPAAPWGQPPAGAVPRGVTPPPAGQSAALFDEAALPDWLRAAAQPAASGYAPAPGALPGGAPNGFAPNPPAAYAPPYAPPAAPLPFSAPAPGGFPFGPASGQANGQANGATPGPSLFDAAALPTWLGGTATPSTPLLPEMPTGASGLAANTLVDPNVLPQWMRDARPPQPELSGPPAGGTVSEWLANPVTDEPLPGFLDQIYAAADVPRLDQTAPERGMPGEQIVDAGALPAWLRTPAQGMYASPAASGVPMPPPTTPSPVEFGAPGIPGAGENGSDLAAGSRFSAKDLVEPDALPAWAQQGQGLEMDGVPTIGEDVPSAEWPDGASGFTAQRAPGSGAPRAWDEPGNGADGAALAAGASQPGTSWPPRGDRPPIPEAELPPWLREGQPPAAGATGTPAEPLAGMPPEGYAGFEEFQGFDAGDMPMDPMDSPDMLPPEAPAEHYADRFGVEMPGGAARFGYEFDYGQAGAVAPPEIAPPPSGKSGKGGKGGKRKGFFRRG